VIGTQEQAKSSSPDAKSTGSDTTGVLRRIGALLYPYHDTLILAFGLMIVAAGVTALAPFLTKAVFDDALFPASGGPDLGLLTWLTIGLIGIVVGAACIGLAQSHLTTKAGNRTIADLRISLFTQMQKMDMAFFTVSREGAVQARLAGDVDGARTALTKTAPMIASNVVTLIASLVAMLILSWHVDPHCGLCRGTGSAWPKPQAGASKRSGVAY
jgi:ATP-binding cassette, subfamily B, bacterial